MVPTPGAVRRMVGDVLRGAPLVGTLELTPMAHYAAWDPVTPDELGFGNVWEVVLHEGVRKLVGVADAPRGRLGERLGVGRELARKTGAQVENLEAFAEFADPARRPTDPEHRA